MFCSKAVTNKYRPKKVIAVITVENVFASIEEFICNCAFVSVELRSIITTWKLNNDNGSK